MCLLRILENIKYPFWHMTKEWPNVTYASVNRGEAFVPDEIAERSICINTDIGEMILCLGQ